MRTIKQLRVNLHVPGQQHPNDKPNEPSCLGEQDFLFIYLFFRFRQSILHTFVFACTGP